MMRVKQHWELERVHWEVPLGEEVMTDVSTTSCLFFPRADFPHWPMC